MAPLPHYIDVDLKRNTNYKVFSVTQNDTDVVFIVRVTDNGLGSDTLLDNFTTITLTSVRPKDKKAFYVAGEKVAGTNEVSFNLGTSELANTGKVEASVQLYSADGRMSTAHFTYEVRKDHAGEYVPSENEATLIETVLVEGPAVIAETKAATTAANTSAKNADQISASTALVRDETEAVRVSTVAAKDAAVTATGDAVTAMSNANAAADLATQEASDARVQKEEVALVIQNGPVASVNGKTGMLTGIVEQPALDATNAQLADIGKHHKNDSVLAKMQRKEPVVIVCYGDSMTWGYVSATVQVPEPYPAALQRKLRYLYGYDGITVYNEGMSGTTSNGGNANYDARVAARNPHLAIIMYGLNDNNSTLDIANYQSNLRSMVDKGRAKGIETILLSPTPTNQPDSQYNLENINYAKAAKSVAIEKGLDFVDMNKEFSNLFKKNVMDQRSYTNGSVHFTQEGYTLIADILIKESLFPYVRAEYEDGEFLSFQSPFVKNSVTTSLVRATSKLQKFFYVKDTAPAQGIGFMIYNDTPNNKFKLLASRDLTGGNISLTNFGSAYATLNNNGEFLIDHEVEIALGIGLHYFELSGANMEVGKQFIASGGYISKPKLISNGIANLTLQNGWLNYGGLYEVARAVKSQDNFVSLEGMIKSGVSASGNVIVTLPVGYRPLKTHSATSISSDGTNLITSRLEIDSTGNITIRGLAHNGFLVLDGIRFLTGT